MDTLTPEELALLIKYEESKKKHAASQAKYREKIGKDAVKAYNSAYYRKKRSEIEPILKKVSIPTPLPLAEIAKPPKPVSKRTRTGKKRAEVQADLIRPMHEKRATPLAEITIDNYLKKADILQRLFTGNKLSQNTKNELKKLLNDNRNLNEKLILDEMTYIKNDIEPTIEKLREHYKNDNSFKGYLLTLTVIASHLKTLNQNVHQILSKSAIHMNKVINEKREENVIDEEDKDKIIDLSRDVVLKKLNDLKSIGDKLLFAVYTLMPARRLDWRLVKVTTNKNVNQLADDAYNYLIMSNPKKVVWNNYKTSKKYGQQVFDITDPVLSDLIDQYITEKKIKTDGSEYLFPLQRDHREPIQNNLFSTNVSNVFKKVYGIPIAVRFLRMSHVSHFLKGNPNVAAKKEFAAKMAHSISEQALYEKK